MGRLTITLSDERQRALKEAAARSGKTIRELIESSLEAYGIKSERSAAAIVAEARRRARLAPEQAEDLAVEEARQARRP